MSPETGLWHHTAQNTISVDMLHGEVTAEFAVVGAGFTGLSAALHAASNGADVCVLESGLIGQGGSGRNVGLVNAGLWTPPDDVEKMLGQSIGQNLNSQLSVAPDLVFSLIEKYQIECEAVRNGTLHLAHSASGLKDLKSRLAQQKARNAPVILLDAAQTEARTGTSKYCGALHDARAGTIQPLTFCNGLAKAAMDQGVRIFENSTVASISRKGEDWVLLTATGATLRAPKLLIATNAYNQGILGILVPEYVPVHYFQAATKPLRQDQLDTVLPGEEGCWDTATVMSSIRRDKAGRLLIGGIGCLSQPGAAVHRGWIRRKVSALYPDLSNAEIEFEWHGRIAMTTDHTPKIVRLGNNGYSVFGFSGRGIGPGTLFGKRIAQVFGGASEANLPVPVVDGFSENRVLAKQVYYETGATATHLVSARMGALL